MGFEIEIKIRGLSEEELKSDKERKGITSEAVSKSGLEALMRKLGY